jgi:tryptophan synthase alpha chain
MAKGADGVVVGSALVRAIETSLTEDGRATGNTVGSVLSLVEGLGAALRKS